MSTSLIILKHDDRIGPGWLLDRCDPERQPLRLVTVRAPDDLPMAIECQGVVLVGRSLDPALVAARDPAFRAHLVFVRSLIALGVPYLGVDRGAQLLALAMRGTLADSPDQGMGATTLLPTTQAGEDRLLAGVSAEGIPAVRWPTHPHSLPRGGVLLAGSLEAPEAFRFGTAAWGLLPHPELTSLAFSDWLEEPSGPGASRDNRERAALVAAVADQEAARQAFAHALMDRFLDCTRGFTHEPPPLAQLHLGPERH